MKINRKTLGWNGAAACFAYGYGKLALQGFKYVGDDQVRQLPSRVTIRRLTHRLLSRLS